MTVAELRKALEAMPDNLEVFSLTDVGLCGVHFIEIEKVRRFMEEERRLADVEEDKDGFDAVTIY